MIPPTRLILIQRIALHEPSRGRVQHAVAVVDQTARGGRIVAQALVADAPDGSGRATVCRVAAWRGG